MKLNIGCGKNKLKGFINLDISPNVAPDIVRDIERGLPFGDNTFDEVVSSHTIEHIRDLIFVMNEIWRVCKPGALVRLTVPYYKSPDAYRDPTHVRFFTEDSLQYFCGFVDDFSDYGIRCRFELVEQEILEERELCAMLRAIKPTTDEQAKLFKSVQVAEIAELKRDLETRDGYVRALQANLDEKDAQAQALQAALEEETCTSRAFQTSLDEKTTEAQAFQSTLMEKTDQIEALQDVLSQKNAQSEVLQANLDEKDAQVQALQAALEEETCTSRAFQTSLDEKTTEAQAFQSTLMEIIGETQALQASLDEKDAQTQALQTSLEEKTAEAQVQQASLDEKTTQAQALQASLDEKDAQAQALQTSLEEKTAEAQVQQGELASIKHSLVWRATMKFQSFVDRFLPWGTRRRNLFELGLAGIRIIINEGWRSFCGKAKRRLRLTKRDKAWLEQEFAKRGPWLTQFTIDDNRYGGYMSFEGDIRITRFFDIFPGAHSILELGCLEGGQTFELAKHPAVHMLSIEGRQSNIERAKFIQQLLGIKNVKFVCGNLETIDLTRFGKFDAVLCSGILYHVSEPWKLIEKIRAVTTKLFIYTAYATEDKADQVVNGFRGWWYQEGGLEEPQSGLSPRSFWLTIQSLQDMLKQYGFTTVRIVDDDPHAPNTPCVTVAAWAEGEQPDGPHGIPGGPVPGRRGLFELGLAGIRIIINEGWRSFWRKLGDYRKRGRAGVSPTGIEHERSANIREKARLTLRPTCNRFALYVSSLGNYFFRELTNLLALGLEELGFEVDLRDENTGFAEDADWHIVAAPHEFFYLGAGEMLRHHESPANLILINFEQPSTQWFPLAQECFAKAHAIWDINYDTSQLVLNKGFTCEHLPFGYVSNFLKEVKELPEHYGTCFLGEEIRKRPSLDEPLPRRPIDVLFIGSLTRRREEFFAKAAPVLSRYHCYLHLSDPARPLITGETTYMDTTTVTGLAQRSKIVVNIHQGQDSYFEWQRIVTHGIWQKALVISEPCGPAPPFRPGIDFVEAPLKEIPERIEYYLASPQGQEEAQAIASQGFRTLTENCRLADSLRPLILQLYVTRSQGQFWQSAVFADRARTAENEITKLERFSFKYPVLPQKTSDEIKRSKIELIAGIAKADSIRDFGGLWDVYGLYMIEGAKALNCKYAEMIDVTPRDEFWQKVRELEVGMSIEVKFICADFRDPDLFKSLAPVDVSILYDVMLHQDNPEEVIKNALSTTKQYICLAQPVLKEEVFTLPNGCVNLQFYPEELKDLLRAPDWWPKEPVANRFETAYWMWGQTISYFKSIFYGYGWDIEHLEVSHISRYWNYAVMRFVPKRGCDE